MSMLLFMPWCPIDRAYQVGEIKILPFEREKHIEGLDGSGSDRANTIMATYKTIEGKPIDRAALITFNGKAPLDELNDSEIESTYELVTIACFSALAGREYFNPSGPYSNSDCFALYGQKFDRAGFTAITTRRREGRTLSGWSIDNIAITVPVHCHVVRDVTMDESLLKALITHRNQSKHNGWGRWQNAISCFNQANTDDDNIRYQVEWVLLCSAFEHILEADSKARDVACKFTEVLAPSEELSAKNARRLSNQQKNKGQPVCHEWMYEFYRIRGDFAHGKLDTQQPTTWNPLEHLFLATIAFPLVIKRLLSKVNKYDLTDNDQAQIDSFERFADIPDFLKPPPNQKGSLDSHWKRLVDESQKNIALSRTCKEAWNRLSPEQQSSLEKEPTEAPNDPQRM